MAYVLTLAQVASGQVEAAGGDRPDVAARRRVDQACGQRATRMTPYGQALLLLTLDAVKDTRGDDARDGR